MKKITIAKIKSILREQKGIEGVLIGSKRKYIWMDCCDETSNGEAFLIDGEWYCEKHGIEKLRGKI